MLLYSLKNMFRDVYPEYAVWLDKAKSQEEIHQLQHQFLQDCKRQLAIASRIPPRELPEIRQVSFALSRRKYHRLIRAKGSEITKRMNTILYGMLRIKQMRDDVSVVAIHMLASGVLALGSFGLSQAIAELSLSSSEINAALAAVKAAHTEVIFAMVSIAIVSLLIPLIYYHKKPANCIVFVLNELDSPLHFDGRFEACGHALFEPDVILKIARPMDSYPIVSAGIIAVERAGSASLGTRYGFHFDCEGVRFSFGVESPLSQTKKVGNNCYCGFNIAAEDIAAITHANNLQQSTSTQDGITLSIKCNSIYSSNAYYIARIYRPDAQPLA